MKLYIDLATRRFVRGQGGTSTALSRLTFKRRDVIALDIDFLQRGEVVPTPAGTTIEAALKSKFSDGEFFALADSNGTLDLYTQPVEDLFVGNTASVSALIEVKWSAPGEAMRTATLAVELQNSVILGDEGTPSAMPNLKATEDEAAAGTSNEKWTTPLRVWDAIRAWAAANFTWASLAGKPSAFPPSTHTHTASQITDLAAAMPPADWATLTGKPSTFPPSTHTHTLADVSGLQTALDAKQPVGSYATSAQGAKADTALQPSSLTPYRTATSQDTIDAGKAATAHTHTASQITDFAAAVAAVAPGGGVPAGALIISKTYAELKALKDASQLVPGQWYKITDFQLKWWNQSKNDVRILTSSEIEPLIVLAITTNKFSENAFSVLYTKDVIYYGFDDAPLATPGSNYSSIPNAHGWISRRISDGSASVDAPYDWRHVTWNCCRLDLSSFPEWSATTTYNRRQIVKFNNKLFISLENGNLNNATDGVRVDTSGNLFDSTNFYWWVAVTPFIEGLTYFPTDDNTAFKLILPSKVSSKIPFDENSNPPVAKYSPNYGMPIELGFTINNYYPPLSDFVTIPWSTNRAQKYTFSLNRTTNDSQSFLSGPVKMGVQCFGNVFYGRASFIEFGSNCSFNVFGGETFFLEAKSYFGFNRFGFSVWNNRFGNSCYSLSLGNHSTRNTFGEDCNYNIFQANTNNNNILGTFRNNILGNAFVNNSFDSLFLSNICAFQFLNNKIGISVIGNVFKIGSSNNVFDGNVANNEIRSSYCKIGNDFNNNIGTIFYSEINGANKCVFPTTAPFSNNACRNLLCCEFSWYVLNNKLEDVSYLKATDTFTYNTISSMVRGIFGYWFRMNTIQPNVYRNINADTVFTSATLVANDSFNKTIFKNSAGVPRLSYYNAADQLVVTSPTA
jgi:hypothetical protein